MRALRKISKWLAYTAVTLLVIAFSLVGSIDFTPLHEQKFYQRMMQTLDTLRLNKSKKTHLQVGWSKFNLLPDYEMPMAGYTPKDKYESVHDSVYCRILSIDQADQKIVIISVDLLLFPPIIKERLNQKLREHGKNYFLYLSATHTHSSIGGWDDSAISKFTTGKFHEEWVNTTVNKILTNIEAATLSSRKASLHYWEANADEFVENRLDGANGKVDGTIRGIKFTRADSTSGILATYSGHATNVDLLSRIISGDYPSALSLKLEKKNTFSIFLAGMVGSHRLKGFDGTDFERIEKASEALSQKINNTKSDGELDSVSITTKHIPIEFGSSQLRIEKNWKVRNWVFSSLIGSLQGEITYLKIGNIIMMGTPCDFSGEIFVNQKMDSITSSTNKHLIITSFNGNYTGYITEDSYYLNGNEEEIMALNWVGPYYGQYYANMITKLLEKK